MATEKPALNESPSQTAGPYVHIGCTPSAAGIDVKRPDLGERVFSGNVKGEVITVTGVVYDGEGDQLKDAMVEIWQADADGEYCSDSEAGMNSNSSFSGWGRSACDAETGEFFFKTIKPGLIEQADGTVHAPHITFWIVARGINLGLQTRMYFPDETEHNHQDPVFMLADEAGRSETLVATALGPDAYRFDIWLQGDKETVFLNI